MEKTNQLHQLLAAEKELTTKEDLILTETKSTFTKKQEHFDGLTKVYEPFAEGGETIPPEIKEVVTSVAEKINYTKESAIRAIDAEISKEETNASGAVTAELMVGDVNFGTFSAISLLALEKQIVAIRKVYQEIPTLDPTKRWKKDTALAGSIYMTDEELKFRTNKIQKPVVLYPATDKHPAQTQMVTDDVQVGRYKTVYKSGKITPADKSKLLERLDEILLAVKQAKARANQAEVKNVQVGEKIFSFVNNGIL